MADNYWIKIIEQNREDILKMKADLKWIKYIAIAIGSTLGIKTGFDVAPRVGAFFLGFL